MKQTLNHFLPKCWLLAGAMGLCMMAPASAQDEESSLAEQMRECASISNAIERLVCFDDLVAALSTAQAQSRGQETAMNAREMARGARESARGDRETAVNERAAMSGRAAMSERAAAMSDSDVTVQARIEAAERRAAQAEARLEAERESQRRAAEQAERRRAEAARKQPPADKTYITIVEAWQNSRGLWRFRLDNGQEWQQTSSEAGALYREGVRYYIEPGVFGSYFMGSDENNRRMRVRLAN